MARRVLVGGLFHETHTFLDGLTPLEDFQVRRGAALLRAEGDGSPLGGVLAAARELGWHVLPTIDLRAMPGATVADRVVETFWGELEGALHKADRDVDGALLVLHGAMVSESFDDVEGEVLRRLRADPLGRGLPVAGVLDLHANVSPTMAAAGAALLAYRENPHTDAEASGARTTQLLASLLDAGQPPVTVREQPPLVWPPTGTGTAEDPMRTLEAMARQIEATHEEIHAVNVFGGFAFADVAHTGVSFTALTAGDPKVARAAIRRLSEWALANRHLGLPRERPLEEAMPEILRHERGPVLIVEPSDNIGGGAPGDGTAVLRALLAHRAEGAVVVLNDPQAVAELAPVPARSRARVRLGGKASAFSGGSVELEVEVVSRSDGRFELEDRQSHLASMVGARADMGPCCVVRHEGVRILLTSRKTPPFDLAQLRSQGIEPEAARFVVVKAAVAHRRAYDPIAVASYTVGTPGACSSRLSEFAYRKVRRPVFPLDRGVE